MEIVIFLCEKLWIERKNIGIAWLKDKQWITSQWLSIGKKTLKKCWWEAIFLKNLWEKADIKATTRHTEPLAVWKNKGNTFSIKLRAKETLSPEQKLLIEEELNTSKIVWFPNTFWIQRFGGGNKNYKKALKIFQDNWPLQDTYEVKFKLQAFWSMRFNEQVMRRRENKDFLLEGDILVNWRNAFWTQVAVLKKGKLLHFDYWNMKEKNEGTIFWEAKEYLWESDSSPLRFPTWVVLGTEQLVCPSWTEARKYDDWIIEKSWFLNRGSLISKRYHLYWFRRPLFVIPQHLSWEREEWNLILNFFLPTWAYASSFLAHILWRIDHDGCVENGLIIPRPTIE